MSHIGFELDIVCFLVLDGDVARRVFMVNTFRSLYGLLVSATLLQTSTRAIRVNRKLLQHWIGIINFEKYFLNFISDAIHSKPKLNIELKTLLNDGHSEPELHDDLVNKLKKLIGRNHFSHHFRKNNYMLQT